MDSKESARNDRPSLAARLGDLAGAVYRATLAKPSAREVLIGLGIFGALAAIMQVGLVPQQVQVTVGQPAPQVILAPRDTEDPYETERQRQLAADTAYESARKDQAYWYIAPESGRLAEERLEQFLAGMKQVRTLKNPLDRQEELEHLQDRWTGVPGATWTGLLDAEERRFIKLGEAIRQILVSIEQNERISDDDLRSIRSRIAEIVASLGGDPQDGLLLGTLRGLIQPNLVFDRDRVQKLMNEARQEEPTVIIRSRDKVLDKGDIVTEEKFHLLKSLGLVAGGRNLPLAFISMVLFVLVLIAMAVGYLHRFNREMLRQERLLYLSAATMVLAALVGKLFALSPSADPVYFAPVTFASILWVLLLEPQVALMLTVLLSLVMGVVSGLQLNLTLYTLIGGCTATYVLYQRRQRSDLMTSGLFIGVANILSVLLLGLFSGVFPPWQRLLLAAVNGLTAAVVAIGLLPFLENLFGLTSAVRLLELSNPNQPLLHRMLLEAPGTYHHSIMVGNLAEAAADKVGADGLLVRVGAYYHDIGKTRRAYFFVENQLAQDNPHEKLTPTLSTLIITAHVKEGVEMARQAGLPEIIVDLIEQHHGTDLVRYFYARAAENAQTELAETDFRYDGPRPRSKEAALVMLADSVEAAVRAMSKPTPAKIEALTAKIIKERLEDGQFDECDLTLRDLEQIKTAFLKVLGGIFHTRIEYPESVLREFERKKGGNGDLRKQPAG